MKNDNNVFQVLVPTGMITQGESVSDLAAGEIGILDGTTKLAIDNDPGAPLAKSIDVVMRSQNNGYIVVPTISMARLNSITKKAYAAGESAKVTITLPAIGNDSDSVIEEEEEIGVTFAIEAGDSYQIMGTNQIRKHFYINASSTANATATALGAAINADQESTTNGGFISATVSTNVVTVTFAFTNDDMSIPVAGKLVTCIPSHTSMTIDDNITGTLTTAFSFAQGKGKYIQTLEKEEAGYNGGTGLGSYRYISDNPDFYVDGFTPDASASSNYDMYVLNYDLEYPQNSGYNDNYEVIIATADSTTSTNISALLNALVFNGVKVGF
jgi:hypothetical protein